MELFRRSVINGACSDDLDAPWGQTLRYGKSCAVIGSLEGLKPPAWGSGFVTRLVMYCCAGPEIRTGRSRNVVDRFVMTDEGDDYLSSARLR